MRIAAGLAGLLLVGGPESLHAQGGHTSIPPGTAFGVTIDRFGVGSDDHLGAATFHISALRPNNLTSEFAVSIFPRTLGAGVLITNLDVGAAINISLPHAMLLLRGGATGLFAFGSGGAMALPGAHYGASLLIQFAEKSGFRLDVLRRIYYMPYEYSNPTLTLGVGITSLPGLD